MSARKTLLVVEDETVAREGLAVILRGEGYEVILAANGEEALHRLEEAEPFDLIDRPGNPRRACQRMEREMFRTFRCLPAPAS